MHTDEMFTRHRLTTGCECDKTATSCRLGTFVKMEVGVEESSWSKYKYEEAWGSYLIYGVSTRLK